MDRETEEYIAAVRAQVKVARGVLRTLAVLLANLDERLDAQPQEAQRNGYKHETRQTVRS